MVQWREEELVRIAKEEKQQAVVQFQSILTWLENHDSEQRDMLDQISSRCVAGTSEWVLKNSDIVSWLRNNDENSFVSLIGKPGSGGSSPNVYKHSVLMNS